MKTRQHLGPNVEAYATGLLIANMVDDSSRSGEESYHKNQNNTLAKYSVQSTSIVEVLDWTANPRYSGKLCKW